MPTATVQRFGHVPAGTGETYNVIGELLTLKVTNADSNGKFSVIELVAQPGGGPPLHTHPSSESFTVLEGEFEFTGLDHGQPYTFHARPGDTVFIPAGAPHTYRATGNSPGRTMLVLSPGTEMERFFAEAGVRIAMGAPVPAGPPDIPALLAVGQKHGLTFLAATDQ